MEISKSNIVLRTIANYLETGVALDEDIPVLFGDYLALPDNELMVEFQQSFNLREQCYAIRNFRQAN